MKVINDLVGYKDLKIVQNPDWFMFSLDSVLLPNFVTLNKNTKKILDLGTGNAPIPLILSTKTVEKIYAIELQEDIYNMAKETIEINNLQEQVIIINDDMKNLEQYFEYGTFDLITSNPPYFKKGEQSKYNDDVHKSLARHEITITAAEIIEIAKRFLNNRGIFAMINRTSRLVEIIELMRKNNIEPKRIRFIYPKKDKESNMFMIEGVKNGNPGLKILPPLYAHEEDGTYTEEIQKAFNRE
jgi:Predicted O-methyltransferase